MRIARKRARTKHKEPQGSASASRAHTPDDEDEHVKVVDIEDPNGRAVDVWVTTSGPDQLDPPILGADSDRPFFANTTFYALVRLIQVRRPFLRGISV